MTTRNQQETNKNSSSDWETRLLRFTCFTTPETQYFVKREWENWWEIIAGNKPENRTENLREGAISDTGKFGNGFLNINLRQERIDILYDHNPQGSTNLKSETLGLFKDASDHFKTDILEPLFNEAGSIPNFSRLAFGGVIYQTTQNLNEVFDILSNYIESIDFKNVVKSEDFLYQNNYSKEITFNGSSLLINRLMKWNARIVRTMFINPTSKEHTVHDEEPTCLLEFDVNTHIDNKLTVDKKEALALFSQLYEMANEMSIKGDSI